MDNDEAEITRFLSVCNGITDDYKRSARKGDPRAMEIALDRVRQCVGAPICPNTVVCSKVLRVLEFEVANPRPPKTAAKD